MSEGLHAKTFEDIRRAEQMAGEGEGVGGTHRAEPGRLPLQECRGVGSDLGSRKPIEKVKPGLPAFVFSELNLRPKFVARS